MTAKLRWHHHSKVKPTSIGILGCEIYDFSGASFDYFSSLSSVFIGDKIWVSYQNASGFAVSNSYDTVSHGFNFHTIQESAYPNENSLAAGPNGEIYAGVIFENNFTSWEETSLVRQVGVMSI